MIDSMEGWTMFSKANLSLYALALALFGMTSCGLKLGEINIPTEPAKVESVSCLELSMKDLKLFMNGDATDDQVANSMQCLQQVFIAFKENIRGEAKDAYTAREIATFVETNFFSTKESTSFFSDKFLSQVMKFKVALIGGNKNFIRKTEVDKISDLIALFKPDFINLNKSMKILTFKWTSNLQPKDEKEKEKEFLKAKENLLRFIQRLSLEFVKTGNAYQIDDLIDFLKEVSILGKAEPATLELIEKGRPFIKKFKITLIGGNYSLRNTEWSRLGLTLNEGLFQILRIEYFLKNLKPEDVDLKWSGYQKIALDLSELIETLLVTKEAQSLSNYELYELSQTLQTVYPDFALSLNLLESFGYLKIMILGDSPSGRLGWSASDFSALRLKIPVLFHQLAIIAKTYESLTVENYDPKGPVQYNEFTAAESKIISSIEELTTLIQSPYNLYSFKVLLLELSKGPLINILKLPENFDSLFTIAFAVKTNMTGQEDNELSVPNLKLLLKVGARGLFNYLEYDLFVKPLNSKSVSFYANFLRLYDKIKDTLTLNLTLKSTPYFSNKELINTISVLQQEKVLKTQLRDASLNQLLNGLWQNILNVPELRLQNKNLPGFNITALNELSRELQIYLKLQMTLFSLFEAQPVFSKPDLLEQISLKLNQTQDPLLELGLQEIKFFTKENIPLNINKDGFLKILSADVGQFHVNDLILSNISRTISRTLIRSYAQDISRVQNLGGITVKEAELAFSQLIGTAKDLGLFKDVDPHFISSRFLEANLFLSTSDGDSLASFSELHNLILHIYSGLGRADMLRSKIIKQCLPPQNGNVLADIVIWEDCLLNFNRYETEAFSDLPQFINLRSQFSEAEAKGYYLSLLKAAGYVPNDKKVVRLADADLFPHIVQFVEMVFARYDLNRDQVLDKDEALDAFPVYHDLIKDLTNEYNLKEKELPGVFIYLLKYSRPPKTFAEKIAFKYFINNPSKWVIRSTRIDLGKVFNFIADSTKPKSSPLTLF